MLEVCDLGLEVLGGSVVTFGGSPECIDHELLSINTISSFVTIIAMVVIVSHKMLHYIVVQ